MSKECGVKEMYLLGAEPLDVPEIQTIFHNLGALANNLEEEEDDDDDDQSRTEGSIKNPKFSGKVFQRSIKLIYKHVVTHVIRDIQIF